MRKILLACILAIAAPAVGVAHAQTPGTYSTAETSLGDLLDNPKTKDILARHLPEVVSSDQIDMARGMTLQMIQQYAPDDITDAKLAQIDADLAKLK
jgi:para-nitrobenzyl esterase